MKYLKKRRTRRLTRHRCSKRCTYTRHRCKRRTCKRRRSVMKGVMKGG